MIVALKFYSRWKVLLLLLSSFRLLLVLKVLSNPFITKFIANPLLCRQKFPQPPESPGPLAENSGFSVGLSRILNRMLFLKSYSIVCKDIVFTTTWHIFTASNKYKQSPLNYNLTENQKIVRKILMEDV